MNHFFLYGDFSQFTVEVVRILHAAGINFSLILDHDSQFVPRLCFGLWSYDGVKAIQKFADQKNAVIAS